MGGYGFQLRTTTFDSWSFSFAEVSSGLFFLLGLKMSLPCEGHQWLNQGGQRFIVLCHRDPPYSGEISPTLSDERPQEQKSFQHTS